MTAVPEACWPVMEAGWRWFVTGGAGGMRRIRLAQPRREASPFTLYILTVEIRLVSGRLLKKFEVKDSSLTCCLVSKTCTTLSMCQDRFRLCYQGDEIEEKRYLSQLLWPSHRPAQITCVVLPPENCSKCGAAAVPSGWKNILTGVPEYHKKCRCLCYKFDECGWRTKRLWTQMVVAWHRSRIELAADADGL